MPLFAIWAILYGSFTLTRPPLRDGADAMHAEIGREMLLSHDWVTPHLNGIRSLEQPPLLYWSIAASFKAFGISVWAARLPIAIGSLLFFLIAFALARRMFHSMQEGFYAGLLLVTTLGVFLCTRGLAPQLLGCLWTTLALFFFWISLEDQAPSRAHAWGFSASCALNVLTLGLGGLLLPLGTVLVFLGLTHGLGRLRRWHPLTSVVVFFAIAAPWHIAAGAANPSMGTALRFFPTAGHVHGFYWYYFFNRNFMWYLHHGLPWDFHSLPVLLFWAAVLAWTLPWTLYLGHAAARIPLRRASHERPLEKREQAMVLCAVWFLVGLVFYTLIPRSATDAVLLLPPLMLVIAHWLAEDEAQSSIGGQRIAAVLCVLGVLTAAGVLWFAYRQEPVVIIGTDLASLPDLYRYPPLKALGAFRVAVLVFAAALIVGTTMNFLLRRRKHARLANCFLAGMTVAILASIHLGFMTLSPALSSRILADAIRPELEGDDLVVINGDYENASALAFYTARQVHVLNGRDSALWYGSFFTDAPAIFEDNASLAKLWNGPGRVFLWTRPAEVPSLPGNVYLIAKTAGKEIVSNQPNSGGAEF